MFASFINRYASRTPIYRNMQQSLGAKLSTPRLFNSGSRFSSTHKSAKARPKPGEEPSNSHPEKAERPLFLEERVKKLEEAQEEAESRRWSLVAMGIVGCVAWTLFQKWGYHEDDKYVTKREMYKENQDLARRFGNFVREHCPPKSR